MGARGTKSTGHHRGLTPARRAAAVQCFRESGIYARVHEALGVPERTFSDWRRDDPTFQAELDAAARELDMEIGALGRHALQQHIEDAVAGKRITKTRQGTRRIAGGEEEVVTFEETEPVTLNIAAVRTALTRMNPEWTHPRQQVDMRISQVEDVWDSVHEDDK